MGKRPFQALRSTLNCYWRSCPDFATGQKVCFAQVWLELYRAPSEEDRELLSEVFQSWYMLGRLGGFNGMNMQVGAAAAAFAGATFNPHPVALCNPFGVLQVFYKGSDDTSYMTYDAEECESSLNAFIHEMSDLEAKGSWMRAWYAPAAA